MLVLRENEKIRLIKRRHWFALVSGLTLVILFFLIIIILIIITFFAPFELSEKAIDLFSPLGEIGIRFLFLFIFSTTLLVLLQISFIITADYYLDCWIVTNQRTIHTELRGLFNRTVSSVSYDKIQDITVAVKGILPTFLRYGDLQIQTAGKHQEFIFKQIPDPYKVQEIIFQEQKNYLRKQINKNDGNAYKH